jgi:peptidoglycan-N-acetylglucosamine deacetylase
MAGTALLFTVVMCGTAPAASASGVVIDRRVTPAHGKLLALTVDDGPDPVITPRILDILRLHKARATFFVLGRQAERYPELLARMRAEGHAIGNHTYSHVLHPGSAQARLEQDRTEKIIRMATGTTPVLFRPPGGDLHGANTREALRRGRTVVRWTISTADTATSSPAIIANNVIHTPNPGDIVLMHDSSSKAATALALPRILSELEAKGWQFVTIPELLQARKRPTGAKRIVKR